MVKEAEHRTGHSQIEAFMSSTFQKRLKQLGASAFSMRPQEQKALFWGEDSWSRPLIGPPGQDLNIYDI